MVEKKNITKNSKDHEETRKNQFPDEIWGQFSGQCIYRRVRATGPTKVSHETDGESH